MAVNLSFDREEGHVGEGKVKMRKGYGDRDAIQTVENVLLPSNSVNIAFISRETEMKKRVGACWICQQLGTYIHFASL